MDTRFCENCGGKTEYTVSEKLSSKTVHGISFSYTEEYANYRACGEPVFVPDIHDANIYLIEDAYRKAAGLITIDESKILWENTILQPISYRE